MIVEPPAVSSKEREREEDEREALEEVLLVSEEEESRLLLLLLLSSAMAPDTPADSSPSTPISGLMLLLVSVSDTGVEGTLEAGSSSYKLAKDGRLLEVGEEEGEKERREVGGEGDLFGGREWGEEGAARAGDGVEAEESDGGRRACGASVLRRS